MASKIEVNLDTSKEFYESYKCKQNDDLTLIANIFENGAAKDLTNCSIVIQARKADNTSVIQNTDINKLDKKFEANLVRDFTRAPGETKIEVVLVESGKQNTTFSFCLEVVGSVIKGAEESKDLITSLEVMQDAVVEMGKISEETKELIKNSGAASKEEINEVNASLAENKNTIDTLIPKVDSLASGSPKGTFATLSALQSDVKANTVEGKKSIYVVTADGGWYFWNGTAWTKGGTYQSTGIAEDAITRKNVAGSIFESVKKDGNAYIGSYNPKDISDCFLSLDGGGDGEKKVVKDNSFFTKYNCERFLKLVRKNATNQFAFKLCSDGNRFIDIDTINAVEGEVITFGATLKANHSSAGLMLYQYDKDRKYISGSGVSSSFVSEINKECKITGTSTIKTGAKYLELTPYGTSNLSVSIEFDIVNWFIIKKNTSEDVIYVNSEEVKFVTEKNNEILTINTSYDINVKEINENLLYESSNLFNINGKIEDGYIWIGNQIVGEGTYSHQNIAIQEGKTYKMLSNINIPFLDVFGNYITHINAVDITDGTFTVPTGMNIKYVCLVMLKTQVNRQYLVEGTVAPSNIPVYERKLKDYISLSEKQKEEVEDIVSIVTNTKPYLNKKIMFIGDSISAIPEDDRGWQKYFNQILKPSSYICTAVPGATICDSTKDIVYDGNPQTGNINNTLGNQIQKIINDNYEAPDIIIIALATNDSYSSYNNSSTDDLIEKEFYYNDANVPLEEADRTNFAGALRYAVETLRNLYPSAQIFICTPVQRANTTANAHPNIRKKGEVIKKVSLRLSIPVIDSAECGIYGLNGVNNQATLDFSDGLHLSAIGAKKLGVYNARKIINWFCF